MKDEIQYLHMGNLEYEVLMSKKGEKGKSAYLMSAVAIIPAISVILMALVHYNSPDPSGYLVTAACVVFLTMSPLFFISFFVSYRLKKHKIRKVLSIKELTISELFAKRSEQYNQIFLITFKTKKGIVMNCTILILVFLPSSVYLMLNDFILLGLVTFVFFMMMADILLMCWKRG